MKSRTTLRGDHWRVCRYVVPVPKQAAVARPWQLQSPVPAPPPWFEPTVRVAVWGIWPPHWALVSAPMLVFPDWGMAFRAAFDRAQFAAIPPPSKQPTFLSTDYESENNGEA